MHAADGAALLRNVRNRAVHGVSLSIVDCILRNVLFYGGFWNWYKRECDGWCVTAGSF